MRLSSWTGDSRRSKVGTSRRRLKRSERFSRALAAVSRRRWRVSVGDVVLEGRKVEAVAGLICTLKSKVVSHPANGGLWKRSCHFTTEQERSALANSTCADPHYWKESNHAMEIIYPLCTIATPSFSRFLAKLRWRENCIEVYVTGGGVPHSLSDRRWGGLSCRRNPRQSMCWQCEF